MDAVSARPLPSKALQGNGANVESRLCDHQSPYPCGAPLFPLFRILRKALLLHPDISQTTSGQLIFQPEVPAVLNNMRTENSKRIQFQNALRAKIQRTILPLLENYNKQEIKGILIFGGKVPCKRKALGRDITPQRAYSNHS
jgi:hypothetical protein